MTDIHEKAEAVTIALPGGDTVPALFISPKGASSCLVLAHGAGAGMKHASMETVASGLAARGVASLRYEFAYMARGTRRPDPPKVATACVRAAVAKAAQLTILPLFAGGRSFGGRMTSLAQAETTLPDVRGLVFFAFPLHPAKAPSVTRAAHLSAIGVPMLFLQGSRDALAELPLLQAEVEKLGPRATLAISEHADHGFHDPKRSGRTDAEAIEAVLDTAAAWIAAHAQG